MYQSREMVEYDYKVFGDEFPRLDKETGQITVIEPNQAAVVALAG
jgi:hypothetical protein